MGNIPQYASQRTVQSRKSFACALLAFLTALAWQFLVVRYNYHGNWTGLFCIGERSRVPPLLGELNLYRFPNSEGYDGQFYYYVAQDPLLRSEIKQYVDNPPLRWRRILLPALAQGLALGNRHHVASAYIGIVLAAVFVGTWWLSKFCQSAGMNAFWGLSFLTIPAVAVSLDRMTVDIVLAALCVAFALYGVAEPSAKIYPVLLLAPLVRETGLTLVFAFCIFGLLRRRWKEAALGGAMALPYMAWALFVRLKLWPDGTAWMGPIPFSGLISRMFHPVQFEIRGRWFALAAFLDYLALIGLWVAVFLAVSFLRRKKSGLLEIASVVFVVSVMFVAKDDVWSQAYAFGRTMSPWLIWSALLAVSTRSGFLFVPMGLNIPRIALQIVTISLPIVRGLLRDAANLLR